ncbi:DUF4097 family beta strand repeat-containing protein [Nocardiopsis metallicus]|uniref:DUF4097 domain-containing protein n=1 Tax=Nocardiopsis metallicus TaxID=179819 RepID=A0A840WF36_9ACTN|nr:DUF4097 family beta strand repeat-containing protein [Nocardiopsis metallicus]MBB5490327.1 hypothetical protein [Nocardiopsis metallicus]
MTFKARGLYASSSKEPGGFRRGPWLLLGAVLVVIVVVFTAVSVLGNVAVHQTDRTDSYTGVAVIRLDNSTGGRVQLHSGDGDEVLVERDLRGSPLSEPDEDIDANGDRLEIDTGCSGFLFFSGCSVNYDITVPAGTEVTVETVSGRIAANGLEGDLNAQTISGDVQVGEHVGAVEAEAISGSIDLEDIEGSARAQSTSGRIVATGSGELLEASTTSGEIDAAGFDAGEVRAESVSGQLMLGGGFTTLEASTVSGNVTVSTGTPFDLMQVETVSGSVEATVPDGTYDVTGESVSGNRDFGVATAAGADSRIDVSTTSGRVRIDGN